MIVSGQGKEYKGRGRYMQYTAAQQDNIGMLLRQMGADVKQINGLTCFVRFDLDGTELMYVYNLNADDAYYLQRVKPYPMSAGVFPDAAGIAEYIQKDLRAFRTAVKSNCFDSFVNANQRLLAISRELEEAFLYHKIPERYCSAVNGGLDELEQTLRDIRQNENPLPPNA